jgi:putative transcriptional regulator
MSTPLRRVRRERDITQAELAERAGVAQQAIARLERGKQRPSLDTAVRIARVLGVEVLEIFPVSDAVVVSR